jgi:ATP-dependent DNA helicase RecG
MTVEKLEQILASLLAEWEGECVEFKDANDNFSTSDIGKYFSALSNEANLRSREAGWLVFGVDNKTRKVIGTEYRRNVERLNGLKKDIANGIDPSTTFREIHELGTPDGRVVMFEIPPAPRGIPIAWNGYYHARSGESLASLSMAKFDEIRAQNGVEDWSAQLCLNATINDLDHDAISKAREVFAQKHDQSISRTTVDSWSQAEFLDRAKLTISGKITRASILLLGKRESTHHLSPFVAELSWKLEGKELAYEHFSPPFLLTSSLLYQRIRNLRVTLLPPGQMIPIEMAKYEQKIVLEALHNCIAHQDYRLCERILVIERTGELEFQNAGSFFDGEPDDYVVRNRTPRRYRNRFLAEAMVQLRMIDTMGFGIREVMFRGQAKRFFPLPDYDLTEANHVKVRLAGRFIDENYSRMLLSLPDIGWAEILALDQIQKGLTPNIDTLKILRKRKLVEGRKSAPHISAEVAQVTGQKADYIRSKGQDDAYYRKLVADYLAKFHEASREDFRKLILPKLPEVLTPRQKETKLQNLLTSLRKTNVISRSGGLTNAKWSLHKTEIAKGQP